MRYSSITLGDGRGRYKSSVETRGCPELLEEYRAENLKQEPQRETNGPTADPEML
jgi:hypothetical protein